MIDLVSEEISFLRILRSLRLTFPNLVPRRYKRPFVNFVPFMANSSYGKIAATTSSRLRCTWASSVIPQVTAT
jgi:hypothetical protein